MKLQSRKSKRKQPNRTAYGMVEKAFPSFAELKILFEKNGYSYLKTYERAGSGSIHVYIRGLNVRLIWEVDGMAAALKSYDPEHEFWHSGGVNPCGKLIQEN